MPSDDACPPRHACLLRDRDACVDSAGGAKMTPPASDDLKFCEHLRDVFEEMNKEDTALQSQMDEIMMLVKGVTDADASAAGAAPSRLGAGR